MNGIQYQILVSENNGGKPIYLNKEIRYVGIVLESKKEIPKLRPGQLKKVLPVDTSAVRNKYGIKVG